MDVLYRRLVVKNKITFFSLSMKKVYGSMLNKVFTIVNTSLVIGIAIIVISMSVNFMLYRSRLFQKYDYYNQITFIRNNNEIETIVNNLMEENIREYRFIRNSSSMVISVDNQNIEYLSIEVYSVASTNHQFLLSSEKNSEFGMLGQDISKDDECIILFPYAYLLSKTLQISVDDLIGKKAIIRNQNFDETFTIVGIVDNNTSILMNYLSNTGILIRHKEEENTKIVFSTFYFDDLKTVIDINQRFHQEDLIIYHYIDNMKNIQTYTRIFTIIFLLIGIVTLLVSFGVIQSSVNMSYLESLPYSSMLKIIGIKDSKIAFFSYIDTVILTMLGFIFAIFIAFGINHLIHSFVDTNVLFEHIGIEIVGIHIIAVIFCFTLCSLFSFLSFLINIRKIKSMTGINAFLYELGDGI